MSFLVQRNFSFLQSMLLKSRPVCSSRLMSPQITIPSVYPNTRVYSVAPKKSVGSKLSGGPKTAAGGKVKEFPVETDTYRLQEYCCGSNILQEGEDVKLKPESEYPEWLFTLHTGPPKRLEELDPNSKEYWEKVRKLARQKKNQLHRLRVKILKKF